MIRSTVNRLVPNRYFIFIYCLAVAFLLLLICSRSSFLYPYNDWNDANSYFSVGKSIFNGKVPYRDVFDQKGFYLYFLYGLSYLISHTTFTGVFVLEILVIAFFLTGAYYTLLLYVKEKTAFLLIPLFGAVILSSHSFYWGGSAEEMALPFFMWGLYFSLRYFKQQYPTPMQSSVLLAGGFFAGVVGMIKFTGLGFFFAWMMAVALSCLIRKDWRGMFKSCLLFLGGMAIAFLPVLLYFAANGALYDMYWGYIYINVFVYSDLNETGPSLWERIIILSKLFYQIFLKNIYYFIFTIAGVLRILLLRGPATASPSPNYARLLEKFNLISLCFFLYLGIYIGGLELPYYALPLSVFSVLGFGAAGVFAEWIMKRFQMKPRHFLPALLLGSLGISLFFVYHASMNTFMMHTKKEEHFLYQFQQLIAETPQPTLLNIGCLDAGLYTVCDIVPSCRWFQTQTLHINDVEKAQSQYIAEGQTDYILARDSYPDIIRDRYELIAQAPYQWDGLTFTYYLFRKK